MSRPGESEVPLRIERRGPVEIWTLARPSRRNTLSEATLAALQAAVDRAGADRDLRAVVIAAEGPAFSSGHDLAELSGHRADADGGKAYFADIMGRCARLMQSLVACPKPVIAAVEGVASAAGCQLVATCDLAVAGADARFVTPGVNIGLFCSTPMVALSRNVPRKHAMEMLLTGDMVGAGAAAAMGLVNRAVPAGTALTEAVRMAETIAAKSSMTVALGKAAFARQLELPLAEAYELTAAVMVENMMRADACEGISAFLEKRKPGWRHE